VKSVPVGKGESQGGGNEKQGGKGTFHEKDVMMVGENDHPGSKKKKGRNSKKKVKKEGGMGCGHGKNYLGGKGL